MMDPNMYVSFPPQAEMTHEQSEQPEVMTTIEAEPTEAATTVEAAQTELPKRIKAEAESAQTEPAETPVHSVVARKKARPPKHRIPGANEVVANDEPKATTQNEQDKQPASKDEKDVWKSRKNTIKAIAGLALVVGSPFLINKANEKINTELTKRESTQHPNQLYLDQGSNSVISNGKSYDLGKSGEAVNKYVEHPAVRPEEIDSRAHDESLKADRDTIREQAVAGETKAMEEAEAKYGKPRKVSIYNLGLDKEITVYLYGESVQVSRGAVNVPEGKGDAFVDLSSFADDELALLPTYTQTSGRYNN